MKEIKTREILRALLENHTHPKIEYAFSEEDVKALEKTMLELQEKIGPGSTLRENAARVFEEFLVGHRVDGHELLTYA